MFQHVDAYAGDPILGLNEAFQKDPRPHKVNLSIGIYFDDAGRIPALDSVRRAEQQIVAAGGPKPYLPMEGLASCRSAVQALLFGAEHPAVRTGRVATIQSVGSSGSLRVGAEFIRRFFPDSQVWASDPTWDNHRAILEGAGLKVNTYPYYDHATGDLRLDAMLEALRALPHRSVVLLHACCHNPTGLDPTQAQWDKLIALLRERELLPFLDLAYQGYGDGIELDAWVPRAFVDAGLCFFIANSFSKSMSLYGERCGALSVVCPDAAQAALVLGQLKFTVRRIYSSPPSFGGQIVARVLGNPVLRPLWEAEVAAMRARIVAMRQQLHTLLATQLPGRNFDYLLTQRGMFSYTRLSPEQVDRLRTDHAVYLVRSGRMCVAGLNSRNIEATAVAMAAVLVGS